MTEEKKRLFFGYEVQAPWPEEFPRGRMLEPSHRHITAAFLGNIEHAPLFNSLPNFPLSLKVGAVGIFDALLFLPSQRPNVVAYRIEWLDDPAPILDFQTDLLSWLNDQHYMIPHSEREWLPHTTLCRSPFDKQGWIDNFQPLPFKITSFNLYESLGNLNYHACWSAPLMPPFEEIDHTADVGFLVYAQTLQQLYIHAQTALFFIHPPLMQFFSTQPMGTLDEVIIALNALISRADKLHGCPLKAVSFHGELQQSDDGILSWEMIVDV